VDTGRHTELIWELILDRVIWSTQAAVALCLATLAWVIGVWHIFGRDDLPLNARAALLICLAPLLVAGLCGALRRMAARRWRRSALLGGTILGGFVELASLFPLALTLYFPMIALVTIGTADARGTATLLLLAALFAVAGGLALAAAMQLVRAAILLDELHAPGTARPSDATIDGR